MISALRELAQLIHQTNPANQGTPLDRLHDHPKSSEFYRALLQDPKVFPSEEDIAQDLYRKGKSFSTYQFTRNRLTHLLLSQLLTTEPDKELSDRKQAYMRALRELTAAKFALEMNAPALVHYVVKRVLRQAKRYEFTDLSVEALRILRNHAVVAKLDERAFKEYNDAYHHHQQLLQYEYEAEEIYMEIITMYHNKGKSKSEVYDYLKKRYDQLRSQISRFDSFRLHMNVGIIELSLYSAADEYEALLEACKEKIKLFEQKPFDTSLPQKSFYDYLLVSATKLQRFEEGELAAQKILKLLPEGSNNWFLIQENYFLLCMHARRYERAVEILLSIAGHPKWKKAPDFIQQTWQLFEAYLYYLQRLEMIEAELPFRLRKFLNNVPIYTKDKRGRNVPVLIIQILLLLNDNKITELLNRLETLARYSSRYLGDKENRRSTAFIKILQQIPAGRFHPEAIRRKSTKYLEILNQFPLGHAVHGRDLEVIPYETLYELILLSLRNQR